MTWRNGRSPKKYSKARRYHGKCEKCGKPTPSNMVYQRIDESNISISYYAPYLCVDCFKLEAK